VLLALCSRGNPPDMAAGGPHEEFQQGQVPPQHALLAVLDQGIEDTEKREELAGFFFTQVQEPISSVMGRKMFSGRFCERRYR